MIFQQVFFPWTERKLTLIPLKSFLYSVWSEHIWNVLTSYFGNFPGGPMVKNPSCNAAEAGSVTKIPHAMGQWSPCALEPRAPQLESVCYSKDLECCN